MKMVEHDLLTLESFKTNQDCRHSLNWFLMNFPFQMRCLNRRNPALPVAYMTLKGGSLRNRMKSCAFVQPWLMFCDGWICSRGAWIVVATRIQPVWTYMVVVVPPTHPPATERPALVVVRRKSNTKLFFFLKKTKTLTNYITSGTFPFLIFVSHSDLTKSHAQQFLVDTEQ